MFQSVRTRHAYKFVRSRHKKLEEATTRTIPTIKGGRTRRFVSRYMNITLAALVQDITTPAAKC